MHPLSRPRRSLAERRSCQIQEKTPPAIRADLAGLRDWIAKRHEIASGTIRWSQWNPAMLVFGVAQVQFGSDDVADVAGPMTVEGLRCPIRIARPRRRGPAGAGCRRGCRGRVGCPRIALAGHSCGAQTVGGLFDVPGDAEPAPSSVTPSASRNAAVAGCSPGVGLIPPAGTSLVPTGVAPAVPARSRPTRGLRSGCRGPSSRTSRGRNSARSSIDPWPGLRRRGAGRGAARAPSRRRAWQGREADDTNLRQIGSSARQRVVLPSVSVAGALSSRKAGRTGDIELMPPDLSSGVSGATKNTRPALHSVLIYG
jgi:hypothetical protein